MLTTDQLPTVRRECSTKSLSAGDGDVIAQIYKARRAQARYYGSGAWG